MHGPAVSLANGVTKARLLAPLANQRAAGLVAELAAVEPNIAGEGLASILDAGDVREGTDVVGADIVHMRCPCSRTELGETLLGGFEAVKAPGAAVIDAATRHVWHKNFGVCFRHVNNEVWRQRKMPEKTCTHDDGRLAAILEKNLKT